MKDTITVSKDDRIILNGRKLMWLNLSELDMYEGDTYEEKFISYNNGIKKSENKNTRKIRVKKDKKSTGAGNVSNKVIIAFGEPYNTYTELANDYGINVNTFFYYMYKNKNKSLEQIVTDLVDMGGKLRRESSYKHVLGLKFTTYKQISEYYHINYGRLKQVVCKSNNVETCVLYFLDKKYSNLLVNKKIYKTLKDVGIKYNIDINQIYNDICHNNIDVEHYVNSRG